MSDIAKTMMRLALRLAEKGDAEGAAEALRGVIAMRGSETNTAPELRAVRKAGLAQLLDCSERHITNLVKKGKIPKDAILGSGTGSDTRFIVSAVFAALGKAQPEIDPVMEAGREDARRRGRLQVVAGGKR